MKSGASWPGTAAERAIEEAKTKGAKRAILLSVSAPFHCALMQPAADAMRDALTKATMQAPNVPLVANVLASATSDPMLIRDKLVAQVTGTVRWRESVGYMTAHGVNVFVELGAGKVLTGLAKKNAPEAKAMSLSTPEDFTAVVDILKQG